MKTLERRALEAVATTLLITATLAGLGSVLDDARGALDTAPTYSSFGYRPDTRGDVSASQAADQLQCEQLHGLHAVAMQLPDGSHRCTDKHGRRLARSVITIPAHQVAAQP